MRRPATPFLLLLLCFSLIPEATAQRDTGALVPGMTLERAIGRGQSHRFNVALDQYESAQVVVDQRGIDLVIRVSGPDQKQIGEYDGPNGTYGPESLRIVALVPGAYMIDVFPFANGENAGGTFLIRVTDVRRAIEPELRVARHPEILKAKGIELLNQLAALAPQMRSKHSRFRLQAQIAQLLWPIDEPLARRVAMEAATGVRDWLRESSQEDSEFATFYDQATQLRNEIFNLLVQQDPDLALAFLRETRVAGFEMPRYHGQPDPEINMEMQVAGRLAVKEPKRAFQMTQELLNQGYPPQLNEVITTLRKSDPPLASALMKDAFTKIHEVHLLTEPAAASVAANLLQAARSPARRPASHARPDAPLDIPLLSQADYHSLVVKAVKEGLAVEVIPNLYTPELNAARELLNTLKGMSEELRDIAPGGVAAIDEKLAQLNFGNQRDRVYREAINNSSTDIALEAIARAPGDLRENLYYQLATKVAGAGDLPRARDIATNRILNVQQRKNALAQIERQAIDRAMNSGKLHEALEGITRMRTPRDRMNMIGQILWRVERGQKAQAVVSFLEQALGLAGISSRPQNQEQAGIVLQIAGAFARYDAPRGFQIVESFIEQFNDLADAALIMNGFNQQYYENDELALNNGNAMAQVASQLNEALAKLALSDPDRARSTAERIERIEVRAAAFLAMAQQMINPQTMPWIGSVMSFH